VKPVRVIWDDGSMTPEQRRARIKAEFDARCAGLEPYPRREKTADEREADARAEAMARADEARDLSPQVWPRR